MTEEGQAVNDVDAERRGRRRRGLYKANAVNEVVQEEELVICFHWYRSGTQGACV
jgi:hypothetical protein